jgi:hypothetical protein
MLQRGRYLHALLEIGIKFSSPIAAYPAAYPAMAHEWSAEQFGLEKRPIATVNFDYMAISLLQLH